MGSHLSLSLSQELWSELLRAALPVRLAEGEVAVVATARRLLVGTGVPGRVSGLLTDGRAPRPVREVSERARAAWRRRRAGVYRRLGALVAVRGTWRVEIDELGTDLRYGRQAVTADAWVRAVAEGELVLVREQVVVPFRFERRVGASTTLARIHYDPAEEAVLGSLQDLSVHLGEHVVLQLLARLAEAVLEPRLVELNPIPVVRRDQVAGLFGGLAGAVSVDLGVEDLDLLVQDGEATLQVRFGFRGARRLTDGREGDGLSPRSRGLPAPPPRRPGRA